MPKAVEAAVDGVIRSAIAAATIPPQQRIEAPQPRWTLGRLVKWVKDTFDIECCRETLRRLMKRLGFSWKKARKLLNKADPIKRAAYLEHLEELLKQALDEQVLAGIC
ncbi:MAG: winged helix-turn-helix domain-containing protein [Elainellaceae cyanobacterium]